MRTEVVSENFSIQMPTTVSEARAHRKVVADILQAVGDARFNMQTWHGEPGTDKTVDADDDATACDTTYCIGGWTAVVVGAGRTYGEWANNGLHFGSPGGRAGRLMAEHLGLYDSKLLADYSIESVEEAAIKLLDYRYDRSLIKDDE